MRCIAASTISAQPARCTSRHSNTINVLLDVAQIEIQSAVQPE
jgi:hypothetical protein